MRNYFLRIGVVGLLLSMMTFSAAAIRDKTITGATDTLARYYWDKTHIYASIQVDSAYIDEVDAVLVRLFEPFWELYGGTEISMRVLLDLFSQTTYGANFEQTFANWLCCRVAIGVLYMPQLFSTDGDMMLAFEIINRAAAEDFLNNTIAAQYPRIHWEREDHAGFVVITGDGAPVAFALNDEVLLAVTTDALFPFNDAPRLADTPAYQETLAMLPESTYNAIMYVNAVDVIEEIYRELGISLEDFIAPGMDSDEVLAALGQQVMGLTILDGKTLTWDIVFNYGDGLTEWVIADTQPLDLSFMDFIPDYTGMVIVARDLNRSYVDFRTQLPMNDPTGELRMGLQQLDATIRTLTGLDLEEDIIGAMQDEYAFLLDLDVETLLEWSLLNPNEMPATLPIEYAVMAKIVTAPQATNIAAGLNTMFRFAAELDNSMSFVEERIGDTRVGAFAIQVPLGPKLELLIAADDDLLVIGSRGIVTDVLTGAPGLSASPAYQETMRYVLPDATALFYADKDVGVLLLGVIGWVALDPSFQDLLPMPGNFRDVGPALIQNTFPDAEETIDLVLAFRDVFSSGSISGTTSDRGDLTFRFVMTLAE